MVSGDAILGRRHRLHQVSVALVLGDHQVDSFLGIVQVEFVVFRLINILAIFVISMFLIQILVDFGSIHA